MGIRGYYQPLRTEIRAWGGDVHQAACDLVQYGLGDCLCTLKEADQVAEVEESFSASPDEQGVMVFRDVSATCGEDFNSCWLDSDAYKLLDHALPGSFFEVCDIECPDGFIGAWRFEKGAGGEVVREYRDFESPFALAEGKAEPDTARAETWEEQTCGAVLSGGVSYGEMVGVCLSQLGKVVDIGDDTLIKVSVAVEVAGS